jgi:hypothetical protein
MRLSTPFYGFSRDNNRVNNAQYGAHYALKGVHGTLKGVHGTLKGVHGTLKGVHGMLKGVHGTLKGVHGTLKGVHSTLKGVHGTLKGDISHLFYYLTILKISTMILTNYNCSQQDLYNAGRLAWDLCQSKLPNFGAFKSKYTPEFVAQNRAELEAADRLPDAAARRANAVSARLDMLPIRDQIVTYMGWLKAYIDDAFDANKWDIMYNAAGQGYLQKAKFDSWGSVTALLSSAIPFIEENLAALTAKDNMPADFLKKFQDIELSFKAAYSIWLAADKAATEQTDEKVNANNNVYANIVAMLTDGQRLFQDDPANAKSFSFTVILDKTHGVRNAGLAGKAINATNQKGIKDVSLAVQGLDKATMTDKDGKYELTPLSAGKYTIIVTAKGFISQTFKDQPIKTGVMSRLNVIMIPDETTTAQPQGG